MKTAILRASLFTPAGRGRWGLPLLFWGEPGVGKSAVLRECARAAGLPCEVLSPGERGEGAFGVVPVPARDDAAVPRGASRGPEALARLSSTVLTYPRPEWTRQFDEALAGLVVVDEITTCPPALQPALLGLLLDRRVGGHYLGDRVRVVAAANPPEQAATGYDLPLPVANRVAHVAWGAPSVEEHVAFMLRGDAAEDAAPAIDPVSEEARVMRLWPEAYAQACGLEAAFLTRRPALKNVCPPAGDPRGSRGWPSDRSWEHATRAFATAAVHALTDVERDELVAGFVGDGAAGEMLAFAAEQDLADPAAVLDGRESFRHEAKRLDRTAALLSGCAALVVPAGAAKRADRARALWDLLGAFVAGGADQDVAVPCAAALVRAKLHTAPGAIKVLAAIQPLLKAAGVTPGSVS